jgi:hypothetical protein
MSSIVKKGGQNQSKGKGSSKIAVADLVATQDPFLATLGRKLRKQQKALESIDALQAEIKSSKKQPDANQEQKLARKPEIAEEMKRDRELVEKYCEAHPDWATPKQAAAAVEGQLRAAFGTFAGLLALAQVREHVDGSEDERAWLSTTLAAYDTMVAEYQSPAARTAFAEAMATACAPDSAMCAFVDRASSKAKLAAATKASRKVEAQSQAKEAATVAEVEEPAAEEKEQPKEEEAEV